MLTSRREMSHRGGGRWSLEQACVWEPSVIHTLLIPIQLCSIKSLRHFTKRGALFGVLWVFVSESLKKKDLLWNKCTLHLFPPDWSRVHHLFIFFVLLTQNTLEEEVRDIICFTRNWAQDNATFLIMNKVLILFCFLTWVCSLCTGCRRHDTREPHAIWDYYRSVQITPPDMILH